MEIKRSLYLNKLIGLKHNGLTMNIYDFLLDAKSLEK